MQGRQRLWQSCPFSIEVAITLYVLVKMAYSSLLTVSEHAFSDVYLLAEGVDAGATTPGGMAILSL